MLRKLRIAFSITCGVLCLLLVVLWVRSYWWLDTVQHLTTGSGGYGVVSDRGQLIFNTFNHPQNNASRYFLNSRWRMGQTSQSEVPLSRRRGPTPVAWRVVQQQSPYQSTRFAVPYWFPLLIVVVVSAIPAIPWMLFSFSLRSLLIATTLVAVALWLVVWAARS
jgi:hypothetical protein